MELLPALGLIALLLVKEAGVPVPVPGDLLVLGAGIAAAGPSIAATRGPAIPAPVLLAAILAAGMVGGSLQYIAERYRHQDGDGRRYMLDNMTSPNPRPNMMYEWK